MQVRAEEEGRGGGRWKIGGFGGVEGVERRGVAIGEERIVEMDGAIVSRCGRCSSGEGD